MRPGTPGQVVRRVLLRRNIVIDAETAQLVAAAVQAALQTGNRAARRGGVRAGGVPPWWAMLPDNDGYHATTQVPATDQPCWP
jgi:hypothetical protein